MVCEEFLSEMYHKYTGYVHIDDEGSLHGKGHAKKVKENVEKILRLKGTKGVQWSKLDTIAAGIAGYFHDMGRIEDSDEGTFPSGEPFHHGTNGKHIFEEKIIKDYPNEFAVLGGVRLKKIAIAIQYHIGSRYCPCDINMKAYLLVVADADKLDLPRANIEVEPSFLYNEEALVLVNGQFN